MTLTIKDTYAAISIEAWAVLYIEGRPLTLDIYSIYCDFKVNEIGKCQITAPIGREVFTNGIGNTVLLRRLVFQVPIEVYVRIPQTAGSELGILVNQRGTYLLFRGFVTSIAYERKETEVVLQLTAYHWLYALNFSSSLSQQSHPANPADLIFNAFINVGAGGLGGLTYVDAFQSIINPIMLARDMWGLAILPWFVNLTRLDRINSVAFLPFPWNDSPNGMCYWALRKFHPTWPGLPVRTDKPESFFILMKIADELAGRMDGSNSSSNMNLSLLGIANKTLWKVLAEELAPHLLFNVVPLPDMALVTPHMPNQRLYYQPYPPSPYTIAAKDVFSVKVVSIVSQPIRALGIVSSYATFTGSNLADDPLGIGALSEFKQSLVGGFYVSGSLLEGMVVFQSAPSYASSLISPWYFGRFLFGKDRRDNRRNINIVDNTIEQIRKIKALEKTLLDELAHYFYTDTITQSRLALVETALRFDICPGSTIALEGVGENYLGPELYANSQIFGFVQEVRYEIDVETAVARTVYLMRNIRNGLEQVSDDFTLVRHPLYNSIFLGLGMMNGPVNA